MRHSTRLLLLTSITVAAQTAWSAPMPATNSSAFAPSGVLAGGAGGFNVLDSGTTYNEHIALVAADQVHFRSGLIHLTKAVAFENSRNRETDAKARERAGQRAKNDYIRALKSFEYAVDSGGNNLSYVPSAWTNIAYIEDKLGNHEAALAAAERALQLAPRLAAARENRGEALLGLNRLADAKAQYLDLYPGQPVLSALLLNTMRQWVQDQRVSGTADPATVEELDQWIRDREQTAQGRAAR